MRITFAGHARLSYGTEVIASLYEMVKALRDEGGELTCYLGGYGSFDAACAAVCRKLKQEMGGVELVYVSPYRSLSEQAKIKDLLARGLYDASLYPPIERTPTRFAISKRNEWMVENADAVIVYVGHAYGGAYRSLRMAKVKGKRIFNLWMDKPCTVF